ncbi:MAG TPA: hypothetical protein VHG51_09040, partial [Longimicrobiaceae bacterium]|nr:hypothetical protein [Longimicrobiaceae bacterium]
MRWHAQVLHVGGKDLRHAGWLLLAYTAVAAAATAAVVDRNPMGTQVGPGWTLSLLLLGMLVLAVLV